ncbi:type II secretion system protein [Ketobacter sp. MCCC 1A13808]|uniref:pilus assembly FimT family protein n=1 Tax=Ketobacter sp. MCCC 1A13808 TaxID=2602738 RepID=UPI0012EBCC89|nr:type II secretion system protein [Ketobacter sp. MCCC 1A13808]MVF10915.1 type II secretion system protein [Ketobacter sp. MCCC 1A13808]
MPSLKRASQAGLTLVELVAVILMVSVIGVLLSYSLAESFEIQRTREAVERAKVIATTIQFARRSSEDVGIYEGNLGRFLNANKGSDVWDILGDLDTTREILDRPQSTFFDIRVRPHTVFVSFSMDDARFQSIQFPAAARSIANDADDNFQSVRYTVIPDAARGLLAAHSLHQFMNEKEEK